MADADSPTTTAPWPRYRRVVIGAIVLLGAAAIATSGLVWQRSEAAFTGTASGPEGRWSAGAVLLNTGAQTLSWTPGFYTASAQGLIPTSRSSDYSALTPGSIGDDCIALNYTGDVNAQLSTYVTLSQPSTMAGAMEIVIQEGSDSFPGASTGGDSSCSGFRATKTDFPPTGWKDPTHSVADLVSSYGSPSTTLPIAWSAPTTGGTVYFRIAWALDPSLTPGSTLGGLIFHWNAVST